MITLALSIYLAVLIGETLLNRGISEQSQMRLIPFWSYRELIVNWEKALLTQIISKILMFIPWGIIFPTILSTMQKFWWNVGSALNFFISIEALQLVFWCGMFEFDDMFHNMLGAVIGYGIWSGSVKCSMGRKMSW